MKVKIGPYVSWWGPYQIANLLLGNPPQVIDEADETWRHRWADKLGDWLVDTWVADACQWIHDRRKRQVYVRIDNYDVWNMKHTLALITLPMLKKLKTTKHGAPKVDDFDCPQHLWSTNAAPKANDWDIDEHWFARWDYVLGEIIWAFEQEVDENSSDQFYDHTGVDDRADLNTQIQQIKCDHDGLNHYEHRKQMGFRLFGKYYQALWD